MGFNHRVDFYRCSVYWVQQASWKKLNNIHILEKSYFSSSSFVYFLIFCLHFRGKYLISDHTINTTDQYYWCVRRQKCLLNIWSKYMPKSKFKTNPCRLQYVYCMNPTSFWNRGFVRWVGWVSILWPIS